MPDLTVGQILDGPDLGLTAGLADLLVLSIGGRQVLYALSRAENLLVEIEIAGDGTMTVVDTLSITGTFPAGSTPLLGVLDGGLTLAGLPASDGQTVTLSGTGALGVQTALTGLGTLTAPVELDFGATDALVYATASGLALATDTGGGYAPVASLADDATRHLSGIAAAVAFTHSGTSCVATVSATENGIDLTAVTPTTLTHAGALGPADGLPIGTPQDIAVIQRAGETLLAIASFGTSSVSIVRVSGGVPVLADHVLDNAATHFAGASEIAAVTHGDFAFLAVAGAEGGVSLMTALPGGRLLHLSGVAESDTVPLDRITGLDAIVVGAALHILTASTETGVARLSYDLSGLGAVTLADGTGAPVFGTGADDQVIGSDVAEALSGGAGDDILLDGAGSDTLTGGAGEDLFVFAQDGQADTVTDFQRGVDKLDLSAFDFLYDISALSITPTATGAILTHRGEIITIVTSDNLPLYAYELTNADILNVDRPPFLPIGQELDGGLGPDLLIGGFGSDTIRGYAGDDDLSGLSGDDLLWGQGGLDTISGGAGNDTILGHADADSLVGGTGDDLIDGGAGDDVIYGDDWPGA